MYTVFDFNQSGDMRNKQPIIHLIRSVCYVVFGSLLAPLPSFAFLTGTWNTHIKSTQTSSGALASTCTYLGGGSTSNGAGSHDAVRMVDVFNRVGHQLWASPYVTTASTSSCSNRNFFSVVQDWNLRGIHTGQMAWGVIGKSELITTSSTTPITTAVALFSASQASLNAAAKAAGSSGVTLAIGVDDFHSTIANVLDRSRFLGVSTLRSLYAGTIRPSGVPFIPYLEALNAMVLLTKSFVLGLPAGSTADDRLWPSALGVADEFDHVFQVRGGTGTPLLIPSTTRKVSVEALIGDSYIASTPGVDPTLEVAVSAATGTPSWRTVLSHSMVNRIGNSGSQFIPVNFDLMSSEITALKTGGLQLRFRMKNAGTVAATANTNKLAIITVPRVFVTHKTGIDRHELSSLMASHPAIYSSSALLARASGRLTSMVQSRLLTDSEQLISASLGDALDGAMLKTDSSADNFVGSDEVTREVCDALRLRGKSCFVVAWGTDIQGVELSLKNEIERVRQAQARADGYISYNFPLDLADPTAGLFAEPRSSATSVNAVRFHWPLDTRAIHGFDRVWTIQIPSDSPVGGVYTLSGSVSSGCSLNADGQNVWSLALTVPTDSASEFSGLAIKDASGAVFSPRTLIPQPGDKIQIHFKVDRSIGSSRCDVEVSLTPPTGYSWPSTAWVASSEAITSLKARQFYDCLSEYFHTGTIADPSGCY